MYTYLQVSIMQVKDGDIGPFLSPISQLLCTHIGIIYVSVYVFGQLTVVQHGMYLPHILLHHCHQYD